MNKKRLIIILAILAIISTVFLFYVSRRTSPGSVSTLKPGLPSYVTGKLPIEFAVQKESFNFPINLPTLSLSKRSITYDSASAVARNLGITTALSEFKDINEGAKYFVNDGSHYFIATPHTSIIKYGLSVSSVPTTVNRNLSDSEITKIASGYIISNGYYKPEEINALPVSYLSPGENFDEGFSEVGKNEAKVYEVGFTFTSTEYELVTQLSGTSQVFVRILPDGRILSSEVVLIGNLQKSQNTFALKTYDDIVSKIGEASLVSFSGDYISPSDLDISDIISLRVEKIKLAYYLEPKKENIILPIYILEGPATIRGSQANSATLYMPAFK